MALPLRSNLLDGELASSTPQTGLRSRRVKAGALALAIGALLATCLVASAWYTKAAQVPSSHMPGAEYLGPELIVDGNFLRENTIGDHNATWVSRQFRPSYKQPARWWSVNAAGLAQSGYWGGYMYQRVKLEANKTYRLSFDAVAVFNPKFRGLLVWILEAPVTYGFLPPNEDQGNKDPYRPTWSDPANRILVFLDGRVVPPTPTNAATGFIGRQIANGTVSIDFPTAVDGEYVLVFNAKGDWCPEEKRSAVGNVSLRAVSNSTQW